MNVIAKRKGEGDDNDEDNSTTQQDTHFLFGEDLFREMVHHFGGVNDLSNIFATSMICLDC